MSDHMPTFEYSKDAFEAADVIQGLVDSGLASTRSEGRRLIEGGGVLIGDAKVSDIKSKLTDYELTDGALVLRKGKKKSVKVVIK